MSPDPAAPRIRAVTRWAAAAVTEPDLWRASVSALGVQYGWPWWNTLLARPALDRLGVALPAVAATEGVWALMGRVPPVGPVPWLVPGRAVVRRTAPTGQRLDPGAVLGRVRRDTVVDRFAPAEVWMELTSRPAPTDPDHLAAALPVAARGAGMILPAAVGLFPGVRALARQELAAGSAPLPVPVPLLAALATGRVRAAPAEAIADTAAWAALTAHGLAALVPEQIPDQTFTAVSGPAAALPWPAQAGYALSAVHAIADVIRLLLDLLGEPARWSGGLLAVASTGTIPDAALRGGPDINPGERA